MSSTNRLGMIDWSHFRMTGGHLVDFRAVNVMLTVTGCRKLANSELRSSAESAVTYLVTLERLKYRQKIMFLKPYI